MMLIFDRFCFFFTILLLLKLSYSTGKLRIRVSSSFKTLTPYSTAHRMQLDLINKHLDIRSERKGGTSDNDLVGSILMVQHPHVYTLGSATEKGSGPFSTKDKMGQNLEFQTIQVDRGGQATYHGPGQLVVYPILDLNYFDKDVIKYLRNLEEVVIQTLNGLGIKGGRDKDYTGVWIEDKKVCAIGLKVTKWISYHGFALNINPDMKYFENIIPCGIKDKGVCSIRDFDSTIDMARVASGVIGSFENVLGVECVDASIVTPENGQNSLLI